MTPAFEQSCCNHRNLIEAYVRGVRNVMDLGAGGVFVDNVHPYPNVFWRQARPAHPRLARQEQHRVLQNGVAPRL